MGNILLAFALIFALANTVCLLFLLHRVSRLSHGDAERAVREELREGREEAASAARDLREEVTQGLKAAADTTERTIGQLNAAQESHVAGVVFQLKALNNANQHQLESIRTALDSQLRDLQERNEKKLDEMRLTVDTSRSETGQAARDLREEVNTGLRATADSVIKTIGGLGAFLESQLKSVVMQVQAQSAANQHQLEAIRTALESQLRDLQQSNEKKLDEMRLTVDTSRNETGQSARDLREEVNTSLKATTDSVIRTIGSLGNFLESQLKSVVTQIQSQSDASESRLEALRLTIDARLRHLQEDNQKKLEEMRESTDGTLRATAGESANHAQQLREEVTTGLKATGDSAIKTIGEMARLQRSQLDGALTDLKGVTQCSQEQLQALRLSVEQQLVQIRESNEKKLEEMRKTVDEQLQGTLEKRLGDSFSLVSERLEAVQRGLGEMQNLATGVGDLKRVLTNVKTRGTWGEYQLGAILEQILNPDQYGRNVQTSENSGESVEYAIRLPGNDDSPSSCVWLPIDSKFPLEDYRRLTEAAEAGNIEAVEEAVASLTATVALCAQTIAEKYLNPPKTTDFAILFLPTEGLYAEVLRQPGLVEQLQHKFKVTLAGPTTLAAILNSLRMGFRTLAIERRTSEVWNTLGVIKTEFGKFGTVLEKVKSQLDTAGNTIDKTLQRTRAMKRKLREVEELPPEELSELIGLPEALDEEIDEILVGGGP